MKCEDWIPSKLHVEFRNGITKRAPIDGRKYTLTHSDETGELFLIIDDTYAYEKLTEVRDEVFAEWRNIQNTYFLYVYVLINGGQFDNETARIREQIFRRELPLALEAIRYGDNHLFNTTPYLDNAPILIFFQSFPYSAKEVWGTFSQLPSP
ncbi:staygreen family protein [Radiobacillus deserti]|uniref:Staygreen protein domain-containing protein n=1 Tax=Radiobacillus deserti TaxID=2594883 RepID=A0A516KKK8_9BACI|nr:staygreen family protein [Radiobacillus deserti]QDP41916.1 hypothetical protein FN924_18105 [Radiobacillus deserti]